MTTEAKTALQNLDGIIFHNVAQPAFTIRPNKDGKYGHYELVFDGIAMALFSAKSMARRFQRPLRDRDGKIIRDSRNRVQRLTAEAEYAEAAMELATKFQAAIPELLTELDGKKGFARSTVKFLKDWEPALPALIAVVEDTTPLLEEVPVLDVYHDEDGFVHLDIPRVAAFRIAGALVEGIRSGAISTALLPLQKLGTVLGKLVDAGLMTADERNAFGKYAFRKTKELPSPKVQKKAAPKRRASSASKAKGHTDPNQETPIADTEAGKAIAAELERRKTEKPSKPAAKKPRAKKAPSSDAPAAQASA